MKPDINVALLNAAQEIINRFSPLIDDEYEKSRLSSWGALILISAMKFNDSGSSLKQENADINVYVCISIRKNAFVQVPQQAGTTDPKGAVILKEKLLADSCHTPQTQILGIIMFLAPQALGPFF